MRNLGDQIAVVFENQALLRSTATTLDEVQTLYNINRAMLGALDPLDMLRVLRDHLAQDAIRDHSRGRRTRRRTAKPRRSSSAHIATRTRRADGRNSALTGLSRAEDVFGDRRKRQRRVRRGWREIRAVNAAARACSRLKRRRSYIIIVVREHGVIEDYHRRRLRPARRCSTAAPGACSTPSPTRSASCCKTSACCATRRRQRQPTGAAGAASCRDSTDCPAGSAAFRHEKELLDYAAESLVDGAGRRPRRHRAVRAAGRPGHGRQRVSRSRRGRTRRSRRATAP